MNHDATIMAELEVLLAVLTDGTLSAQQRARLGELLRDHPEARRVYKGYIELHVMLEWESGVATEEPVESDLLLELLRVEREAETVVLPQPALQARSVMNADRPSLREIGLVGGYVLSKPSVWGSLAAILALAFVLTVVFRPGSPPAPIADQSNHAPTNSTSQVATLTAEQDAQWAEGALTPGSSLHAGQRLALTHGFAQITTARGAVAILEAPCTVELLDSNNAIYLHDGKLVGLCHTRQSQGFVVRTDHATITDLGTEFGVEVNEHQITTAVFVGEVEVTPSGGEPQRIIHNQTATLSTASSARTLQISTQRATQFTQRLPRSSIVTAARINIPGLEPVVVPQGVREDAVRSTDALNEINGVDAQGLPAELLGGDLIQMPIAARDPATPGSSQLSVELDLAQPADVYLIIFADQSAPDWLTRDYELTAMRVGLDQERGYDGQPADVGPGQGIDFIANVWRLKQPAQGTVVVAGPLHQTMSMYCLVVQPHEDRETQP